MDKEPQKTNIVGPLISALVLGGILWRSCIYSRTGVYATRDELRRQVISASSVWDMDPALTRYYASQGWSNDLFGVERNPNDAQQLMLTFYDRRKSVRGTTRADEESLVCNLFMLLLECDQRNWKSVAVRVDANDVDFYGRANRVTLISSVWTRTELSKIAWDSFNKDEIYSLGLPLNKTAN